MSQRGDHIFVSEQSNMNTGNALIISNDQNGIIIDNDQFIQFSNDNLAKIELQSQNLEISRDGNVSMKIKQNCDVEFSNVIQLTKASGSTLSGTTVNVDTNGNKIRFFESGGSNKGAYIDISQASSGTNTLLNNRVSSFVNAGTFVTMDNIKATVTTSGNRGLSLSTVSGTFNAYISGTYTFEIGGGGSTGGTTNFITTPSSSVLGFNFAGAGDTCVYIITDTTNNRCYRITLVIGPSYLNNMISIERLI